MLCSQLCADCIRDEGAAALLRVLRWVLSHALSSAQIKTNLPFALHDLGRKRPSRPSGYAEDHAGKQASAINVCLQARLTLRVH